MALRGLTQYQAYDFNAVAYCLQPALRRGNDKTIEVKKQSRYGYRLFITAF